jgi:hypothetical protein
MLDGYKRMIVAGIRLLILVGQQLGWVSMDASETAITDAVTVLAILGLSIYSNAKTKKAGETPK